MSQENSKENKTIEAYRTLHADGRLMLLHEIKKELTLFELESQGKFTSSFIFGTKRKQAEKAARQYLLLKAARLEFNEKLLLALACQKKINDNLLPFEWRKILKKHGLPVAGTFSALRFRWFILIRFLYNIQQGISLIVPSFRVSQKAEAGISDYVQFCDLTPNCIPWSEKEESFTAIDWYIQWNESVKGIQEIRHNIRNKPPFSYNTFLICPDKKLLNEQTTIQTKCRLTVWFLCSIVIALYSLIRGKWINALMLYDALLAKIVQKTGKEYLAKEYLFSISSINYRPFWTYAAEEKGSIITNYSYASSFGGFKGESGYPDIEYYFDGTAWPRLLYWTENLVDFVRSRVPENVAVIHTGFPVFFSDSSFVFPDNQLSVAVFDVTPFEPYINVRLLPDSEYRSFENGKSFLKDIYDVFRKSGYTIIWKRKRGFYSRHNREYIQFCDEFEKLPGVLVVNPEVSACRVARHCKVSVTMPFTSTAFIADHYNKPSAFYDPSGTLYKDDRGRQGLPLLSNRDELEQWKNQLENLSVK